MKLNWYDENQLKLILYLFTLVLLLILNFCFAGERKMSKKDCDKDVDVDMMIVDRVRICSNQVVSDSRILCNIAFNEKDSKE